MNVSRSTGKATPSDFAREVVLRLQAAGYQALWAGGCVRDELLGRTPKDYDVATNAIPEQVRDVFGRRRTLFIGAAFGVVAVVGPKSAGTVEVATFRRDEGYSDGRHPDRVAFSTASDDAARRDFTVNGLFYNPVTGEVLDYVEGQADLRRQRIRCIGAADERFAEDKLRMLRAIRFAAGLGFEIEPATYQAIRHHADELKVVSAERIAAEMRHILVHSRAANSLNQLRDTGLWRTVLPEYAELNAEHLAPAWQLATGMLSHLSQPADFSTAVAAALWPLCTESSADAVIHRLATRWRLSNHERDDARRLLKQAPIVIHADHTAWPQLQPVLVQPGILTLVDFAATIVRATAHESGMSGIEHCRKQLSLPPEQLNPAPLVCGHDLIQAGIAPGARMGELLTQIREAQLEGQLTEAARTIDWARQAVRDQP